MRPLLAVRRLSVVLPSGVSVVKDSSFEVKAGEVACVLGPSGVGKTTLLRAVLTPEELRARGYDVAWEERHVGGEAAFVPQRGALFDHLDVAGNIALAQAATGKKRDVAPWLAAVDLPPAFGEKGTRTATLSGGQAQRVAIARTLAAGRSIVVLDEPSVGLDPLGVRQLARLLHAQARAREAAVLVITHDLVLAAGASDVLLFFDPATRRLEPLFDAWTPAETEQDDARDASLARLAAEVELRLAKERPPAEKVRPSRRGARGFANPLRTAGQALLGLARPRLVGPTSVVAGRAFVEALLRPLLFYAVVGGLLGFTVPYVLTNISQDLGPKGVLKLLGGNYVLSLAPPVSAILFAATSGNAVNAWLGGLDLSGQVVAMRGIGVDPRRYLVASTWLALVVSYALVAVVFVASMIAGGYFLFDASGVDHPLDVLTSNFVAPVPDQVRNLLRGLWLFGTYAFALASFAVAKGSLPKEEARQVTAAMTGNVIVSTLFIVAMELASSVVVFASKGQR